jgi:hypothetical protein
LVQPYYRLPDPTSPLGELEASSCSALSVFLSFLDPSIAGKETSPFKDIPQLAIVGDQGSGNTVSYRFRLTGKPSPDCFYINIELISRLGKRKRLLNCRPTEITGEVFSIIVVIYDDIPLARTEINPGNRFLPLSGTIILDDTHSKPTPSRFKINY